MTTFQAFIEALLRDGILERITDTGVSRLLAIYEKHDLQPPTVLLASAVARGLITKH